MTNSQLKTALSSVYNWSRTALVQHKCKKALAKIKTAETLIKQAEATLVWARAYRPD